MTTDVGSLRLNARIDEGVGPAIVMLHGINSDGGDWRTVIDTIGPGYRFIAFDLLGFGDSPKPLDIEYSADDHALAIESTLLEMGVDDPFLLAGYSLGGDIALRYASTYPHRLRRLFLLDAPFYLPPEAIMAKGFSLKYAYEKGSRFLWNMLASSKEKDTTIYKLATGMLEGQLKEAFHSDDLSTHWEIMSSNLENTVNKATFVDDLPKLTMPTVFALGVRDTIVRVSQTPALKRLKPDMEIRKIGGLAADHMVLWNMPERVGEELMRDEVRELNVVWRGGSGAPLVLLHSLKYSAEAWLPTARILARNHDVAVIDLLGFGDSPAPPSLHYTLADHVAAVMGTIESLWGPTVPVRLVGEGFGGTVALGCAATVPARSGGVVAFSPALLDAGGSLESLASDQRAATALSHRDLAHRLASDEHGRGRAAEKAEHRLTPLVRSVDNGIEAIDSAKLLAQTPAPVRFVVPTDDPLTPEELLADASTREGFEVDRVDGPVGLPYHDPAEAVRAVDPDDADGIALAAEIEPAPDRRMHNPVANVAGDLEGALFRTGLLNLVAAALLLLLDPPEQYLTYGFAAWVALASLSVIVGAVTMKHRTAGERFTFTTTALPTLLLGLLGLGIAAFIALEPDEARSALALLIALYATARGAADLFVATRVGASSKPRWLLYVGGILALALALAILFGADDGAWVVRVSLSLYLGLSGVSLVAYVISIRRQSKRRTRELLGD